MKKSFILYENYWNQIRLLDFEQCGRLLKAIFSYTRGKELPELDPMTHILFSVIADQLDRDREKYEDVSKKRAEAGKKGAAVTNAAREKKSAIADDNENEKEKEKENETVNENKNEKENETENEQGYEDLPPDVSPMWRKIYNGIMERHFSGKRLQNALDQNLNADRKQNRPPQKAGFV